MTGSLMRDLCEILPKRVFPAIVCVSAILWFLCGVVFNGKVSLYRMELGRYWLFIASGLTGSILWFGICWTLRKVSVFQRWGQNTIFVVCTQYVGITLFRTVMSHIKLTSTVYFDIIALVVSSAAMFAYMPICSFINVYLPFLAGKEEKICRV